MSQTSYSMSQDTAVAGQIASAAGAPVTILTYNNPADVIKFGHAVGKVTADENGVKQPVSGSAILGVAVRDQNLPYDSDAENSYPIKSDVAVMRRGQIYVYCEEAVTPDDSVFVRFLANDPLNNLGAFRTDIDDDGGAHAVALATAKFLTSAAAGGYAVLDLNIA